MKEESVSKSQAEGEVKDDERYVVPAEKQKSVFCSQILEVEGYGSLNGAIQF